MRLAALVNAPDHVSARYRLAAFAPIWARYGVELRWAHWSPWWWPGARQAQAVREADVVVVQRRLLSGWSLRRLRKLAKALVFDFDDAVFGRDTFDRHGTLSERRQRGFARMVKAADLVVAGNEFLREHASLWTTPDRIRLVPTCLDPQRYPLAAHRAGPGQVKLAWIGSASTLRSLEQIRPFFEQLGREQLALNLKIICDRSLMLTHLPVQFCPWSSVTEAADLADADIGVSWLPDDEWSRGKCALKVLQYMASGLPVVANPVGLQASLVRPGETGFLVRTQDEWLAAIGQLASDPDLRRRMGAAGRRWVETDFHVHQGAALWLDMLKTLQRAGRQVDPQQGEPCQRRAQPAPTPR